jgi:hypothetical protein
MTFDVTLAMAPLHGNTGSEFSDDGYGFFQALKSRLVVSLLLM